MLACQVALGCPGRAGPARGGDRPRAMSQPEARIATRDMSTEARAPVTTIQERPVAVTARARGRPPSSPLEEFEQVYLRNVDVLMGYFARRCRDPRRRSP